ncbi:DsrE family protein [Namhaeicola litoreus]|uniref:DsrE family protein n=1 Tax=Namhaeicola litoreus TaxID=1052145 RepID=A0ABW3Y0I1_9FLAO
MKTTFFGLLSSILFYTTCAGQIAKSSYGPVFDKIGATYTIENADLVPDSTAVLKAVFDIDYRSKDSLSSNPLISSLHRYLNMHVKNGVKESNISLAFVLHGASTKDAMTDEAYLKKYGIKNPNTDLIKTLAQHGVEMYICGQSAAYKGLSKAEMMPEIKLALSAMTVLTIYQAEGYALIKF